MRAGLIRADSVALPLRDSSVDLVVTSPPYYSLRSYQDGGEHYSNQIGSEASPAAFLAALWAVTDELWRVLKPSGSVFLNLGDKYAGSGGHNNANLRNGQGATTLHTGNKERVASEQYQAARRNAPDRYNQTAEVRAKSRMLLPHRYALGCVDPDYRTYVNGYTGQPGPQWICRSDMVWSKPNGLPESVTDRVRASHEYWFHLVKQGDYYAGLDEIRDRHVSGDNDKGWAAMLASGDPIVAVANGNGETARGSGRRHTLGFSPLGKLPGSVWTIPTEPLSVPGWLDVDHYAAFPTEWPRRLILGWSPPGICTACGEGRRAEVETNHQRTGRTERTRESTIARQSQASGRAPSRVAATTLGHLYEHEYHITGERCACPTPDAPTQPACVLDPFGGTGTTAMIARALGRYGVNVDLSADYLRLADWRIHDSGDWDRAVERTTGRRCDSPDVIPGQMRLL